MKAMKLSLVIVAAALVTIGLSGMAYAFHSGGVADCDGCHTMHGVVNGSVLTASKNSFLLQGTDFSSTCLNCHSGATLGSHSVMTYDFPATGSPPVNYTPGGDFAWLQKTYNYTPRAGATQVTENGQTHGHNVIAADFGMTVDSDFPTSPGGSFPSNQLACVSCHDPHGKYRRVGNNTAYTIGTPAQLGTASLTISGSGSTGTAPGTINAVGTYRLLAGIGYSQNNGSLSIAYPGAPIAVAPSTYNQAEASTTTQVRVAYGSFNGQGITTWSQWCGTCHAAMIGGTGSHVHPVDVALNSGGEDQIYGKYVSSGNVNGTAASSYLSLVPFVENQFDIGVLKGHASNSGAYQNGPAPTDQVSCPSCHRAHASGFPNMMRWNMENEFIVGATDYQIVTTGATGGQGRTHNEALAAYYGRDPINTFGAYQRSLCNKCHAQD